MKIYKRNFFSLIKSLIIFIIIAFIVYVISNIYLSKLLTIILTIIVIIGGFLIAFFKENIKFIIKDNILEYYENEKLKNTYDINKLNNLSYKMVKSNNSGLTTLDLYLDDDVIDCIPLGEAKFLNMYNELESMRPVIKIKGD